MVTSAERLRRLLALVPYVVSRKVVSLSEAAAAFGMTERELIDDLNLAWCVELKAPEPYCPIDLSYEGGEITVSQAESIARPLRLAADEASALLVALRMLAEVPADGSAVGRLIAKIEGAAGASAAASSQVMIQVDSRTYAAWPRRSALLWARAGACTCATTCLAAPRRPSATWTRCGSWWWRAARTWKAGAGWPKGCGCSGSTGYSTWTCSTCPAEVPAEAEQKDVDAGLFRPSESDERVELELAADARWVAEYYPCESVTEAGEGRLRAVLRTPDTSWVRRLALRLGEDARVRKK